jgi:hypothetical protein
VLRWVESRGPAYAAVTTGTGEARLRSTDRQQLPVGARYPPIYTIQGASGRSYGDAAGLVELPQGQGKILYVWGGLLRDLEHDFPIAEAAVRYLMRTAPGQAPGD